MKTGRFEDKSLNSETGKLYVVSTPIGNLGDITYRAVEVLKSVKLIAAEDTRRASILTGKYEINTPRISFNDFNCKKRIPGLIGRLSEGEDIAIVTDAGTPGISDPGFVLIRACIEEEIPVVPVPGPAALIAALVISGLPTERFVFEGFLPVKKGRKSRLTALKEEKRTIIFYESPHRIGRTLKDLYEFFGDRDIAIVRELTKIYEEVVRVKLSDVLKNPEKIKVKGEFVLILQGAGGK